MTAVWLLQRLGGETTAHDDEAGAERASIAMRPKTSVVWLCSGVETDEEIA